MDISLDLNKNFSAREDLNECLNSLAASKGNDIKDYLSCFSETLTGNENENKKLGRINIISSTS